MRILRAIHSMDPRKGGVVEAVMQSSLQLSRNGCIVDHVSLDDPDAAYVRAFPLELVALGPGVGAYGYSTRWVDWLKANAIHYDAVIIEGLWQYHGYGTWRALRYMDVPYFVYTHGMLDPWFKKHYPLKHLKKMFYWWLCEYWVLKGARRVLFTAKQEQVLAQQSFWPYKCKTDIVPLGLAIPDIDIKRVKRLFLERYSYLKGKRILLFMGRVHEKKGIDLLLESWRSLQESDPRLLEDAHLFIAGPGGEGLDFKSVGNVSLGGMLSGDIKWGAMSAAEAFILPSHQENFGMAVVEAMAMGKPVFISNKINICEEILSMEAGVVKNDSLEGTVELVKTWWLSSCGQRIRWSDNLRKCYETYFTIEQASEKLLQTLKH